MVKNLVIPERGGKVRCLSETYKGKKHNKAIADKEDLQFPDGSTVWQDRGFQGFAPEGMSIQQPEKKPRNGSLTLIEKINNQRISSLRVEVEHYIGGIKRLDNFRLIHRAKQRRPLKEAA
ncbi:MAG: transposase family protein [Kaiparowitsia implicata GSE-PSE-MK54-09C]|jgi:hypothetical protein|nr:transposase family protein [Kaiparowitsia implicata GSE-PSE-MK54-09C]